MHHSLAGHRLTVRKQLTVYCIPVAHRRSSSAKHSYNSAAASSCPEDVLEFAAVIVSVEDIHQPCRLQAEHQRQLTLVFQQHTGQVVELQRSTQLEESLKWRQHLAALEGQFRGAKDRADRLQEELKSARSCIPWTPAAHEVVLKTLLWCLVAVSCPWSHVLPPVKAFAASSVLSSRLRHQGRLMRAHS